MAFNSETTQQPKYIHLRGEAFKDRLVAEGYDPGQADLKVQVDVPLPLKLLPEPVLERSGQAFLNGILLTIKYRLERQLVQDYRRWVKAKPAGLMSPLAIPVESPTS